METQQFRILTTAQPPFVSIYIDDSRDTAEADSTLDARWRELRGELKSGCVDEHVISEVAQAILHSSPAIGRRGRGVIAGGDGVLINEHLPHPPAETLLRTSDYPFVLPMLDAMWRGVYIFAAVDHNGADITLHRGDTVHTEAVGGEGYPVHKPVTSGWNGYDDHQRSAEEAVRMNVRATADRLTELVDKTDAQVVFVCGETRSRSDVVSALPRRVARRVSPWHGGALGHRINEAEARDHLDGEFERRRAAEVAEVADLYLGERGRRSGLAVEGLAAVCAALREGCVDTLIVGDLADATVVTGQSRTTITPDADTLSDLGEPVHRVARADEALPFVAIATDASLVRAGADIAPEHGIAALLRYAPSDI
ncbi:hypothetical protein DVS77_12595 [Mycolicibacterium moriokaense]|nr:hypothetical protein DVS77_12595 [Mycolicibacterium moriokaense]